MSKIVIIGGGLAGSLTAVYMAKRGHDVHIIESRGDPREDITSYIDKVSSRSIGVSMTVRGIKAVLAAGIPEDELNLCGLPVKRMAFFIGGKFRYKTLIPEEDIYPLSLSRSALQKLLNKYATLSGAIFHYNQKCLDVDLDNKRITMRGSDGSIGYFSGDLIIGTDGARSVVRHAMQNRVRRFDYHQSFFKHGYKTIVLPSAESLNLDDDILYFFGMDSKGKFAGRAATIPDGSCSLVICLPYRRTKHTPGLDTTDEAEFSAFVDQYYSMFPAEARGEIVSQFLQKPSNDFINARSSTFHYQDKALILGDSAHATVPFLGQGMNMALEDAFIFAQLMAQYHDDLITCLSEFTLMRKEQADAMQDMALANYDVLSNANKLFFMRIKYTEFMHNRFPKIYPPNMANRLYFTSMKYSDLQIAQETQNRWYKIGRVN